ncbi:metallophosphoesterase [Pararhodobacter sp. CCB-MM2]|uniref:metallophosphoesterase family protein n=1 Tax=Pararhodobacter sp. CCB-MM2 TaxID=1786003 RepID=UPI000B2F150C|nr:metallophosphoesterase [Pararhodobacter sp. CCB-MM2]
MTIPALLPRGPGHQFVFYGDSCSGVPGAPHAVTHATVNRVVQRLAPPPAFIAYPGDEVIGLTDEAALRAQWAHWLDHEMAWATMPMHHCTGNHTAWDAMSARVFHQVMRGRTDFPAPDDLNTLIRHGDLALVIIDTLYGRLGGEGWVDLARLDALLTEARDARHLLVMGHHPAFAVNGFHGPCQRNLAQPEAVWALLKAHGVTAYLCSHILAFDVQVHEGVLQICSGGAGTAHRMPEGVEYLHAVQMALDAEGLRLQVLDDKAQRREALAWPPGDQRKPLSGLWRPSDPEQACLLSVAGQPEPGVAQRQTLACAVEPDTGVVPIWIGLSGPDQRLTVLLQPQVGRSPHLWRGPALGDGLELLLHPGMGPGGLLWRRDGAWTSLEHTAPWGLERFPTPLRWQVGARPDGSEAFVGRDLSVTIEALAIDPVRP